MKKFIILLTLISNILFLTAEEKPITEKLGLGGVLTDFNKNQLSKELQKAIPDTLYKGVFLRNITKYGALYKSGLREGDIINRVGKKSTGTVQKFFNNLKINKINTLQVYRGIGNKYVRKKMYLYATSRDISYHMHFSMVYDSLTKDYRIIPKGDDMIYVGYTEIKDSKYFVLYVYYHEKSWMFLNNILLHGADEPYEYKIDRRNKREIVTEYGNVIESTYTLLKDDHVEYLRSRDNKVVFNKYKGRLVGSNKNVDFDLNPLYTNSIFNLVEYININGKLKLDEVKYSKATKNLKYCSDYNKYQDDKVVYQDKLEKLRKIAKAKYDKRTMKQYKDFKKKKPKMPKKP